jgi:hypothetical protein
MTRILAALAALAVILVALRRRKAPAVMRQPTRLTLQPGTSNPAEVIFVGYLGLQPSDPFPASLLP